MLLTGHNGIEICVIIANIPKCSPKAFGIFVAFKTIKDYNNY